MHVSVRIKEAMVQEILSKIHRLQRESLGVKYSVAINSESKKVIRGYASSETSEDQWRKTEMPTIADPERIQDVAGIVTRWHSV
jgi:Leu/Phe-tRNA-protein transferase